MANLTLTKSVIVSHYNASGIYTDTETVIEFHPTGSGSVDVKVKCLPGLVWWECPSAAQLRAWVDAAIAPHGLKRSGPRYYRNDGPLAQWWFVYAVEPVA